MRLIIGKKEANLAAAGGVALTPDPAFALPADVWRKWRT